MNGSFASANVARHTSPDQASETTAALPPCHATPPLPASSITSVLEQTLLHRLSAVVEPYRRCNGHVSKDARLNILRVIFLRQGVPTTGTVLCYAIGCIIQRDVWYSVAGVVISLIYIIYGLLHFALLKARATEMRQRVVRKVTEVCDKWSQRVPASLALPMAAVSAVPDATAVRNGATKRLGSAAGLRNASALSEASTEAASAATTPSTKPVKHPSVAPCSVVQQVRCFDYALLSARSLRLVACRIRGALYVIPKCLVPRGAHRFDEYSLRWDAYREGTDTCGKVVDCIRVLLERDAVRLKPLTNLSRPPRLPNLRIAALLEEEAESTDESDGEHEPRSVIGGLTTSHVPQRYEFFLLRVLTLVWLVGMPLLVCIGFVRWRISPVDRSWAVECLLSPALTLMGLIPLNMLLVNRCLHLINNVLVHWRMTQWVQQHGRSFHSLDALGRASPAASGPSTLFLLRTAWQALRRPGMTSRLPVFLARPTVETLGSVTVVAQLDSAGVLTDLCPVPVRLLVIKENTAADQSSSSSDEDERLFLTQKSLEATRLRKREMRLQVRRKKFQEERFTEMKLEPFVADDASSSSSHAVAFCDPVEKAANTNSINPVCLCIALHAAAPLPVTSAPWVDGIQFVDRTMSWITSLNWLSRAGGFEASIARNFTYIARLCHIATVGHAKGDSIAARYPDQMVALVVEDEQRQTHVFALGTTRKVIECCSSYWTGSEAEEFDDHEKAEVAFFSERQWGASQGMEAVAVAHRVLPDRYQRFVAGLRAEAASLNRPVERYFVNNVEINAETAAAAPDGIGYDVGGVISNRSFRRGSADDLDGLFGASVAAQPPAAAAAPSQRPRLRRVLSHGDLPQFHSGPLEADATLTSDTFVLMMMHTNFTMLGLVALRESIRPHVQSIVNAFDDAGIRFMHFGSGSEQRTKAFGDRLGLETDWNCCISLKAESVALDPHSIRAQLPFGIASIRKHIIYVDPIPLQVSLFSHSRGCAARSLLSVLQDNHEVVLAIGSLCNHSNTNAFVQADYSIGVVPSRVGATMDAYERCNQRIFDPSKPVGAADEKMPPGCELLQDVAELLSAAVSMDVGCCPNILPIVHRLIRECRLMLSAMNSCTEFIVQANGLVVCITVAWLLIGTPLFLTPGSIIYVLNVVIPLLGVACNNSNHHWGEPMKQKQAKQHFDTRLDMLRHHTVVFALRYVPTVLAMVGFSIAVVPLWCGEDINAWQLDARVLTEAQRVCFSDVSSVTFYVLLLWLLVHSLTQLSRHQTVAAALPEATRTRLRRMVPQRLLHVLDRVYQGKKGRGRPSASTTFSVFHCGRWFAVAVLVALLAVFFEAALHHDVRSYQPLRSWKPTLCLLLAVVGYPICLLCLDIPIKRWRRKRYSDMQKFRTLSYGTRLGMHSPRGDYEPSEGEESSEDHNEPPPQSSASAGRDAALRVEYRPSDVALKRRFREFLFRWCSISGGSLELQCVCCDHIGGHPAQYC